MVLKRGFSGGEEYGNPQSQPTQQPNQRRLKFTRCLSKDKLWQQAGSAQLENLIRKVVREEVEQAIQRSWHPVSRLLPSESRKFKLHFEGKLPNKLFTGNKVEAEGQHSSIKLFLLDAVTGHRVTEGPLSSLRVKIVALHGHYKAEELQDWTKHEFDKNVVFERDGKRPLLVGQDIYVTLQKGIGCVGDVCFTDNSSWERSKMFRLGAKAEAKEDQVREAVSSPFEVKDRRGENYQKHKIPSPDDEVWRLRWIAKDGKICQRLAEHQIYKVRDFVTQYYLDESLLRQILKVSPKKWEAIIQRATSCFAGNPSRSLNDLASFDMPCLNQKQFCVPPAYHGFVNDEQEIKISDSLPADLEDQHGHQLNESMTLENSLIMDLLHGSCSERGNFSLDNSMLPSFPTMFDFESSSWPPVAQPIGEEDNSFSIGSCYNPEIRMLSSCSIPNVSVNSSEVTKPKEGWGKVRAVWRILVKHDEAALRKGKFPRYSQ